MKIRAPNNDKLITIGRFQPLYKRLEMDEVELIPTILYNKVLNYLSYSKPTTLPTLLHILNCHRFQFPMPYTSDRNQYFGSRHKFGFGQVKPK